MSNAADSKRDEIKNRLEAAKKRIEEALKNLPNASDRDLIDLDRDTGGGGGGGGGGQAVPAFVDFNKGCN